MAKRKIGELRGHPIVVGDINLKDAHEIHITQLFKKAEQGPKPDEPGIELPDGYQVATSQDISALASEILGI